MFSCVVCCLLFLVFKVCLMVVRRSLRAAGLWLIACCLCFDCCVFADCRLLFVGCNVLLVICSLCAAC